MKGIKLKKGIKPFVTFLFATFAATGSAATGDVAFSSDFDTEEDFGRWKIVDNNGGRSWELLRGKAAYMLDYQTGLPGNDWLISPVFSLNASYSYELTFDLGVLSKTENMRVCLSKNADMSEAVTIADFVGVVKSDSGSKTFRVTVPSSGEYYLGFYAYSDPNMHRVEIDNVKILEYLSVNVPDAVDNLTAVAGDKGALSAKLSFQAPSATVGGASIDKIETVKIYRDGVDAAVATLNDIAAGAAVEWTDNAAQQGFNTYTVIGENASGEGAKQEVAVFVGNDITEPVANLRAQLNSDRNIMLTWTAPQSSVNGGYVDYSALKYRISRMGNVIEEAYAGTEYVDAIPVERGQQVVNYTVSVVTAGGESSSATSNNQLAGTPITEFPYNESFKNEVVVSPWVCDGAFEWKVIGEDEEWEVATQDHDNGMITAATKSYYDSGQSRYISPMFNLSSMTNPVLTFWFYHAQSPWYDPEWDGENNDRIEVQMSVAGGEWKTLDKAIFYNAKDNNGWVKCEVVLPKNAGNFVNIGLLAIPENDSGSYRNIYVDNLTIDESTYVNDLAVSSFSVDNKRISVGEEAKFEVNVKNRGGVDADNYTIELLKNGEVYTSKAGTKVAAAESAITDFVIEGTLADTEADSIEWRARVVYAADEFSGNNSSDSIIFSVRRPEFPIVENLRGESNSSMVTLSWDKSTSIAATPLGDPIAVTDDFENYTPFAISGIGDWTMVDIDKASTLVSPRIPNKYEHQGEPMAFQVFNIEQAGVYVEDNLDQAFRPNSGGKQYLLCPSVDYPAENDDWLISPRLDGRAQTISFFAKAASYDSEWIVVYYSTTDKHPDSFIKISEGDQVYVLDGWQKYSYAIPDGAKYFAIRCVRRTVFLFVDDITYNKHNGAADAATLKGYNVYRNGEKLNAEVITDNTFSDAMVNAGESYEYRVTAVYEEGESFFSDAVKIGVSSGVNALNAMNVTIVTENGSININAPEDVSAMVYTIDGRRVYATENAQDINIGLSSGVYIVRVGNIVKKVAVK